MRVHTEGVLDCKDPDILILDMWMLAAKTYPVPEAGE